MHVLLAEIGLVHAFVYATLAVKCLINQRRSLSILFNAFQNTAYYWQLYVIAGLGVLLTFDAVMFSTVLLTGHFQFSMIRWVSLSMSAYMLVIAVFSIFRPQIFYAQTKTSDELSTKPNETAENKLGGGTHNDTLIDSRTLTNSVANSLMDQLDSLMSERLLYQQNDLSLQCLAKALEITPHQASELLNRPPHNGFYNYLNDLRLQHACTLLKDQACKLRILDIAFESGFSNKNSFYKVFRKKLQHTPQAYRKQISLEMAN